jgi:hypothetical protein
MQQVVVATYRRLETTYRYNIQESSIQQDPCTFKMGPIGRPEASVMIYRYPLCNNPGKRFLIYSRRNPEKLKINCNKNFTTKLKFLK